MCTVSQSNKNDSNNLQRNGVFEITLRSLSLSGKSTFFNATPFSIFQWSGKFCVFIMTLKILLIGVESSHLKFFTILVSTSHPTELLEYLQCSVCGICNLAIGIFSCNSKYVREWTLQALCVVDQAQTIMIYLFISLSSPLYGL